MQRSQRGFTLIEFMISSLAAMALIGATFTLMNSVFTANDSMTAIMATQANIRVAINTIARDITMAGTGLPVGSVEVPNGDGSDPVIRPGMLSFSSPYRDTLTPNNALPFLSPGNGSGPTITSATDALTIFSVNQETPTWKVSTVEFEDDRYEVTFVEEVYSGASKLVVGDLLLFNNSEGSVLACVTATTEDDVYRAVFRDDDVMRINQPGAAGGNLKSLSTDPDTPTYPPTTAIRVNLINYFISTLNGRPRLMRAVNNVDTATAQVIAEDIENLQFSYDLFDYDTEVETSNQETTANPNQIRSVLVAITGRSAEPLNRTSKYYRFQLVSKINIRNATFRNRYSGG